MSTPADRSRSRTEWEDAVRRAFLQDVLGALSHRPTDLLPFEELRNKLRLHSSRYVGLRDVPLDQIVGSTDRYADFNRVPSFSVQSTT